ncbi:MAG: DNA topoisomerase 3 [Bacteroidales bacterium]|nr:DNA topoisomerase 3 [Bacteroidales bacterium]
MKVCVAEKPSVAGEIANILGATARRNGYYEGNGWCVTWVYGHLCELKEPHEYNIGWKSWSFDWLPVVPQKFGIRIKNDEGVKRQFEIIKNLISQAEEVVNCGDAGQEGELIQRWVYQLAGMKCPMKRLWISSLTEESIREGFNSLKAGSDFDLLYQAGAARAMADWLLGMNATRAYTIRYATQRQVLSIGRVQTPTLALMVQRHKEIENFKPETYWELKTKYRDVIFSSSEGKYKEREKAEAALKSIEGKDFEITDIQTKEGNEAPPRLFDLTSLQVECNKKYSFSAEETLQLIQSLYEKKLTTYPRVDTTYLSDDIYPKVPQTLQGLTPYMNLVQPLLGQKIKKSKKVFDNSKVTDHHAIIPTGVPPSSSLPRNEKLVYDLVARRFIANFYEDSKVSTTTVVGKVDNVDFKCSGKQILSPGWRVVYGNTIDDESKGEDSQIMPDFVKGEHGPHEPQLQEKQTTPPKPYTEATLLRAMETAGKQVDDDELRDLMKDNGIGRPSTRAAIIATLLKRNYVERQRKNLIPTATGIKLIETIGIELLKSVEMTGLWEKKLRQIEKGEYQTQAFLDEMKQLVTQIVYAVRSDDRMLQIGQVPQDEKSANGKKSKSSADNDGTEKEKKPRKPKEAAKPVDLNEIKCPLCGRQMLEGKSAWGCSGFREGCQFRVPFELMHKKLTLTQLSVLCKKKQTGVINGFVDETGVKRSGKIVVADNGLLTIENA